MLPDCEEKGLRSSLQETSCKRLLAGKNTGVNLVSCYALKYVTSAASGGVDIPEVSRSILL